MRGLKCKLHLTFWGLEARVGIEPTHKGFADLKDILGRDCTGLQVAVNSINSGSAIQPMQLHTPQASLQFHYSRFDRHPIRNPARNEGEGELRPRSGWFGPNLVEFDQVGRAPPKFFLKIFLSWPSLGLSWLSTSIAVNPGKGAVSMSSLSICPENDRTINLNGTEYSRDEARSILVKLAETLGCEVYETGTLGELVERHRQRRLQALAQSSTLGDFQRSRHPLLA